MYCVKYKQTYQRCGDKECSAVHLCSIYYTAISLAFLAVVDLPWLQETEEGRGGVVWQGKVVIILIKNVRKI